MRRCRAQVGVKLVLIAGAAVAAATGGLAVVWYSRPAVSVTRVIEGPVVQAFYATGTVRPRLEYPISSNVAGVVEKVLVSQGQAVRKGQELALVVDPMLEYNANKTAADLRMRREFADPQRSPVIHQFDQQIVAGEQMLQTAQQEQQRFASLSQRNAGSANDLDQAREHTQKIWSDVESLKAQRLTKLAELTEDLEVAQAADRAAQENQRRQTLTSPVDGVVLDQPIAQGTHVEVNGHVMQIADVGTSSLIMRAAVDEENIAGVRNGQDVKMTLYSFAGRTFDGIVEQKYPKADPNRRTFDVDVRFALAEPKLQPGMTGELAFIEQTRARALIVPAQAVQAGAVWAVQDGKLVKTAAAIGIKSIERVEITEGLRVGDTIVISPIGALKEGQSVWITSEMDPKVAANLNKPKQMEGFNAFQD